MLRTQNLKKLNFDTDDPWSPILASVAYAIRSTYHTTLGATPAQLIFGRDMIYPLAYIAEWDVIKRNKQRLINKNNERENSTRVDYDYTVGDEVLIIQTDIQRKLDEPMQGPFNITKVYTNGTVEIARGSLLERINIRRLRPYFAQSTTDIT